ncbi:BREX system P-loop protein BrxC [Spirosoma linguale]|uniref:BREX system P-loop protein BrxC n=1 Tax=Spirosoma linguale (strain ATCC 33905 / DSM 74 / LMG 10896 / Claus 1) TaxID=504472 RepID=D2QQP1_SPILD|nr:hypothetical protein Slin_4844 [Spirosoma linguale DSM 74]
MLTTIKEIFEKSIDRRINPAVVVDNTDPETITTEIDEYVFTASLTEQLYKLLNTLGSKAQIKTGIWINGYYGSGKSHFLKFFSYCLSDQNQERAFRRLINEGIAPLSKERPLTDATPANAENLLSRLRGSGTEVIMFNVEAVSPDNIKSEDKFLHMLLKQFNKHRGLNSTNIPLALLLENHLQQSGLFDQFIQAVESKYRKSWRDKATDLFSLYGINIVRLAAEVDPSLDADMLFQKLKQPDAVTIEDTLIPELRAYIQTKPANYRLVFLLDEVSQYIGRNKDLLLNLQTIIEALEKACNRQVWVACTAQQTLEEVTSTAQVTKEDEIGKILGRFETRIALDNKDAEFITQKRVLDKSIDGQQDLQQRYRQHAHAILNQFQFGNNTTYRGFGDEDEFVRMYPFVPYQFPLILNVFDSFSQKGYVVREVKNNERSVLGITHATIQNFADEPIGGFVPFDAFFNDLFRNNLLQVAQQSIYRAEQVIDRSGERLSDLRFAKRVLRALFMLANLNSSESRRFPATREQLVTLLMTGLDDNRLQLANRTQDVLDVLIAENIIYLNDDAHFAFYKEEEIEVANQIRRTNVLELDRLDNWNDVFLKSLGLNKETRYTFGKNTFRLGYGVDRKDYGNTGDIQVRFFVMDGTDAATLALNQPAHELAVCISAWLNDPSNTDNDFSRDVENYIRTRKYLGLYYTASTGSMADTLRDFEKRNAALLQSLTTRLKTGFASIPMYAGQQRIDPAGLSGNQPDVRLKGAIEKLFNVVFKYQTDVNSYAHTNDGLRENARNTGQLSTDTTLTAAEQRVEDWINNRGGKATVADVVKAFEDRPFGWKDLATIDVLLGLVAKKRKEIEYQNSPLSAPTEFVEKAIKTSERTALLVRTTEDIAPQLIQHAIRAYGQVFNKTLNLAPDPTAVQGAIKTELSREIDRLAPLTTIHAALPFAPALTQLVDSLRAVGLKRDAKMLFETLVAQANELRKQCDAAKELDAFITDRLDEYVDMRQYVLTQKGNFSALPEQEARQARDLYDDLLNNPTPQEAFALNRKRFLAVKRAIGDSVTTLRQTVRKAYETAFDELDAYRVEHGHDDPHTLADRDQTLLSIDKLNNLTELDLKLARVGDFKAEQLRVLIQATNKKAAPGSLVREPVMFEYGKQMLPTQIASETELDQYLAQLRHLLKAQLDQNKVVIFN